VLTLRIEFLVPLGSALRRHFTFCARSTGGQKSPETEEPRGGCRNLAKDHRDPEDPQRQPKELVMIPLRGTKKPNG